MNGSAETLNASQAAARVGVSIKALRLYEERGLIAPARTEAGWRVYSPSDIERAGNVVALRRLGLSLRDVESVLDGDATTLRKALVAHEAKLACEIAELTERRVRVHHLRQGMHGHNETSFDSTLRELSTNTSPTVAFDLPWPWGGERFELYDVRPINYIVGPLGSGKTRLAKCLAANLPSGRFVGLDRLAESGALPGSHLQQNPQLARHVDRAVDWLVGDGADVNDALLALLAAIPPTRSAPLIVDLVENGLSESTQRALISYLRGRGSRTEPLFLMTRSTAILDIESITDGETILFCPANHSPPFRVVPSPGALGYEAVTTCLAPPSVRARTEGVVAKMM